MLLSAACTPLTVQVKVQLQVEAVGRVKEWKHLRRRKQSVYQPDHIQEGNMKMIMST
jgi:hypothetical protein